MRRNLPFAALIILPVWLVALVAAAPAATRHRPPGNMPYDFYDNFSDGTSGGDPDWSLISGAWRVNAGGRFVSRPTGTSLSLAAHQDAQAFEAGPVRLRVKLTANLGRPSVAFFVFAWQDEANYRYVRLSSTGTRGVISIGQVGSVGGEAAGVRAQRALKLTAGKWHDLRVNLYPSGKTYISVDGRSRLSANFAAAVAGRIGLRTHRTLTAIDNFRGFRFPVTPETPPPSTGRSLRLMTYNVAMLATGDTNEDIYLMDDEERAGKLALGILRATPDVFTLNEVFAEDGRGSLYDWLSPFYPNVVKKLDATGVDVDEDSGLMLFSRHPFIPLTYETFKAGDVEAVNNGDDGWDQVAFIEYTDHSYPDSYANKGCALARIQDQGSGEKFTVVFTHLQASYGDDDQFDTQERMYNRSAQLRDCRDIMIGSVAPDELTRERLFMMGDLNVDGNTATQVVNYTTIFEECSGLCTEWDYHFSNQGYGFGNFYACGDHAPDQCNSLDGPFLTDTAAYETVPEDLCRSTGNNLVLAPGATVGERLDYILRNKPTSVAGGAGYCTQHVSLPWEVGEQNGLQFYSDHLPVRIDTNINAAYCNPLDAREITFPAGGYNFTHAGNITYPGSMQWLVIDMKGTYSMAPEEANIAFDVYQAADLSRPVKQFHEETSRYGDRYEFPDPPYYIRIYAVDPAATGLPADRTWTGAYTFRVHRHTCATALESCGLYVGDEKTFDWPAGQFLSPNDTIWYSVYTEAADSGELPLLTWHLTRGNPSIGYTMAVRRDDDPDFTVEPFDAGPDWTSSLEATAESKSLKAGDAGGEGHYYLTVHRESYDIADTTTVRYSTTLTIFTPLRLSGVVQNDFTGDDEIWVLADPDNADGKPTYSLTEAFYYFGSFDEGTTLGAEPLGVRKYIRWLPLSMIEEDAGLNGDNDYFHIRPSGYSDPAAYYRMRPLGPEAKGVVTDRWTWGDTESVDDADYWYDLDFQLQHERR